MKNSEPGFTILELIVVIAGLGILSSPATFNVTKYIEYSREDQASSLMNSVSADCLQNSRLNDTANIEDEILSEQFEAYKGVFSCIDWTPT